MLNLKALEDKLDLALAQETEESLANWLNEKRYGSYAGMGNSGLIEPRKRIVTQIYASTTNYFFTDVKSNDIEDIATPNVPLAA